jgi:O-antigen ligase
MSPTLALVIWLGLLLALLRHDPAADRRLSSALWIPVIWLSIIGSRLPAQWLSGNIGFTSAGFSEGSALDRAVYLSLIAASLVIVIRRRFDWTGFIKQNAWLAAFLCFALISVTWSDYPLVAFKRWIRDLGVFLAIFVVISSPHPLESASWVLRRVFYLLIPLSVVFVKYFPHLAREYDHWTGAGYFVGVATSKNMLGVLCMVSTLFFLWDTLARWPRRDQPRRPAALIVNGVFIAMSVWLLSIADSATSTLCLLLGSLIVLMARVQTVRNRPIILAILIPSGIAVYALLQFALGVDLIALVSQAFGRTPDLTGRTAIWNAVLNAGANPIFGAGYETFWLGPRLEWLWSQAVRVNTAHNGYLDVYLNLGAIGLTLMVGFLCSGYVKIAIRFLSDPELGSFALAIWTILLFYNVTESALRLNILWVVFLLMAVTLSEPVPSAPRSPKVPRNSALGRMRHF